MNAVTPIIPDPHHARILEAVTAWNHQRGKAIELFARSELVITKAIQCLAVHPATIDPIRIESVASKRTGQLITLLSPGAQWAKYGSRLLEPLTKLLGYSQFRNFLCHGHATLYASDHGHWIVRLEMMSVLKGCPEQQELLLTGEEVQATLLDLSRETSRIANMLAGLGKKLDSPKANPSAPAAQASR